MRLRLRPTGALLSLLLVGALLACTGEEPPVDAGCAARLPAPSDPCLPRCGNDKGVGQPCTEGGGECNRFQFDGAFLCTVDFDDTDLAFCTLACASDDQCGAGAVCGVDPDDPGAGAGCVPSSCMGDAGA